MDNKDISFGKLLNELTLQIFADRYNLKLKIQIFIMKINKKICAALLSDSMTISLLTGCSSADKDAIYQIMYNLCDNAIKFAYDGGKYKICIKQVQSRKIAVSVYNEGVGIPADDLPFVFERFYKSDKSRGLDKSGVGLGLYIAKTIIEAHEESITVNSEYEKYCEFVFTLSQAK